MAYNHFCDVTTVKEQVFSMEFATLGGICVSQTHQVFFIKVWKEKFAGKLHQSAPAIFLFYTFKKKNCVSFISCHLIMF
jgi:hypothetical protein